MPEKLNPAGAVPHLDDMSNNSALPNTYARSNNDAPPNGVMIVIGGSRGIGAAVSRMAANRGWTVLFSYTTRADAADDLAREITASGGSAHAFECDARHEGDIAALFAKGAELGTIRSVVYSTGITGSASPLAEASADTLRSVIDVNLLGALLSSREAVRALTPQGGSITLISSRASQRGSAGEYVWYAATKGALDSLCIGLSREVASSGIRVNCVSPGPVATEMLNPERLAQGGASVPMQRAGDPAEIAEAVLFLASDAASYITGANLAVAGGA